MVDVGMRQNDGAYGTRLKGEMAINFEGLSPVPLQEPAFEQMSLVFGRDRMHRSRYRLRGTPKGQFHESDDDTAGLSPLV